MFFFLCLHVRLIYALNYYLLTTYGVRVWSDEREREREA